MTQWWWWGEWASSNAFAVPPSEFQQGVALRWSEVFNAADCMQNNFIRNSGISKIYRQSISF